MGRSRASARGAREDIYIYTRGSAMRWRAALWRSASRSFSNQSGSPVCPAMAPKSMLSVAPPLPCDAGDASFSSSEDASSASACGARNTGHERAS